MAMAMTMINHHVFELFLALNGRALNRPWTTRVVFEIPLQFRYIFIGVREFDSVTFRQLRSSSNINNGFLQRLLQGIVHLAPKHGEIRWPRFLWLELQARYRDHTHTHFNGFLYKLYDLHRLQLWQLYALKLCFIFWHGSAGEYSLHRWETWILLKCFVF